MEEDAKIAAQKSGRLSFYVVNAIADGCTMIDVQAMGFPENWLEEPLWKD